MKSSKAHRWVSLVCIGIVPATVAFVLTVHPAIVFAESGVATSCSSVNTNGCEGKAAADRCDVDAGRPGTCQALPCAFLDDAGTRQMSTQLVCVVPAGEAGAPANGDGGAGSTSSGGSAENDDAAGGSSSSSGCSIATPRSPAARSSSGGGSAGAFGAVAGGILALAMFARRRRHAR